MKSGLKLFVAVFVCGFLPLCSAHAEKPALAQSMELSKFGEGKKTWFGISVYTASLWGESDADSGDIYKQPLLLTINYDLNTSNARIIKSTRKEWQNVNGKPGAVEQTWLKQLADIFPDIRIGDQLSSLVIPERETRFYLNNKPIGRINDAGFGPAFMAIWLDPDTSAKRLRANLLANFPAEAESISAKLATPDS